MYLPFGTFDPEVNLGHISASRNCFPHASEERRTDAPRRPHQEIPMPGGTNETYDVFLSHSSRDKPWVADFARQLRDQGLKVFYDADAIEAGGNSRRAIGEALFRTRTKLLVS